MQVGMFLTCNFYFKEDAKMYFDVDGKPNKPTWVRLNVQEFIDHYDINTMDDILDIVSEDPEITEKMGMLFWNLLLYSVDRDNELFDLSDREQKLLFKIIKRGIDNSYARYEQLAENGKKGGRPKKVTQLADYIGEC
jgi:hypothetical protein